MHPEQKHIYQNMTAEKKLRLLFDLQSTARKLKTIGLRKQHPDWTDKEIQEKVREIFLYARS